MSAEDEDRELTAKEHRAAMQGLVAFYVGMAWVFSGCVVLVVSPNTAAGFAVFFLGLLSMAVGIWRFY